MNKTTHERGVERGRIDLVKKSLEENFGPLSDVALARLERMSADDLRRLIPKIGTAGSLAELGLPESDA